MQNPPAPAAALPALQNFIFDLDGVIWRGNSPIEGAVEAVAQLKAAGKRCFFCTNNSRKEPGEFAARLREVGIEADEQDVMTSSLATVYYLESQYTGPYTAYVIGEAGLVSMLRRTGSIITTSPLIPQRSELHGPNEAVDCVIVGIDSTFSYHKLRVAQRLILGGARFIATNRDSTFPTPTGVVPGAGAIVASVETSTGVSPIVLGKPQPLMLQLLMQRFGLQAAETAMVGDRIDTDMSAAHRAGIRGLFVATGVQTEQQARCGKGEQKPDAVYPDLTAMCLGLTQNAARVADAFAAAAAFGVAGAAHEAAGPVEEVAAEPVAAFETLPPDEDPLHPSPAASESPEVTLDSLQGASGAEVSPFDNGFSWLDERAHPEESNGTAHENGTAGSVTASDDALGSPFAFDDLLSPPQQEAAEVSAAAGATEFESAATASATGIDAAVETETFSTEFAEPEASNGAAGETQPAANGKNGAQGGNASDQWWDSLDKLV